MEYIERRCLHCDKKFMVKRYCVAQGRGKCCSKECRYARHSNLIGNQRNGRWKGGYVHQYGYKLIRHPNHPFATKQGYVREHRLVMERELGRYLEPREHIHHINGNKLDNRIENLMVLTNSEHQKIHAGGKQISSKFLDSGGHLSKEYKEKMRQSLKRAWASGKFSNRKKSPRHSVSSDSH